MLSDLKVHTVFLCDSKTTMTEYCEEAIRQGVKYVCFTDSVDYNKNDYGYEFYKPQVASYFKRNERNQGIRMASY